ncbi:MAG: DUF6653 family protein [Hyphomicrobiaceae bacterium]
MASWIDRHWAGRSNPWCVYTRLAAALGLVAAVGSYRTLGPDAAIPVGLCLLFILVNPFIFPAPRSKSAWATRAVLGQRRWRERRAWDRPTLLRILSALAYLPALILAFEGMRGEAAVFALVALFLKLGYLDWMARFHDRIAGASPEAA